MTNRRRRSGERNRPAAMSPNSMPSAAAPNSAAALCGGYGTNHASQPTTSPLGTHIDR